jgi:sugar diacid utilization regulator
VLADAYWPAILGCRANAPRPDVADAIELEARANVRGALSVALARRTVLLHPSDRAGTGICPVHWFRHVAERAHQLAPSGGWQVIVGERALGLGELSAGVAELDALWALGPGSRGDQPLVSVRHYALDRLLARVADAAEARDFVHTQIGPLIEWDRRHESNLLGVLEAGLDFARHDTAAARCYMHRNTFRHRFRQALELLGDNLDDPEVRLAVHVALKLRSVVSFQSQVEAAISPRP